MLFHRGSNRNGKQAFPQTSVYTGKYCNFQLGQDAIVSIGFGVLAEQILWYESVEVFPSRGKT